MNVCRDIVYLLLTPYRIKAIFLLLVITSPLDSVKEIVKFLFLSLFLLSNNTSGKTLKYNNKTDSLSALIPISISDISLVIL